MSHSRKKTICEVHNQISKIACQKFYSSRSKPETAEEWEDVCNDMQWYFDDIDSLIWEALEMWQQMENWLRNRKEFMESKWLEDEYQS